MNRKITYALAFMMTMTFGLTKAQLAGSYTIGGTAPDYATLIDAVTALSVQGVSAPVVFNIRDGVYPGKLSMNLINGATFTNTITFQSENGDSTLVTITEPTSSSSAANYLISMTNTDYVTFNQVTLERSGILAYSHVIELSGGCDYNNFTNCVIKCGLTTGTSSFNALVYSAPGTSDNYNIFDNNIIENGSFGFYIFGTSATILEDGNMIMNSRFTNQINYGIQAGNESEFMVQGNYITATSTSYGNAIYVSGCTGNTMVMENTVELPNGGTGISIQQANGGAGAEVMIANNFIHIGNSITTSQAYGIRINSCSNTGVYFNSVNITANVTAANNYAFNAAGAGTNVMVYNNIFKAGTGFVVGINNNAVAQMNFNDLYKTGFNFAMNGTTNYTSLAAWQTGTGFDTNSVSVDPLYFSATDLHIQTFALNAIATPVAGITNDIDGDVRDVATPDIGADETTPPSNDVGVTKLLKPLNGACGSATTLVGAIVKNYAALPQSNITVIAEVTGTQTATLTGTIAGPIDVYNSDTVWFTPTLNTFNGDSLVIKLYTSIANDEDNSNDTLEVDSIYINAIPAPPSVPATVSTCAGSSVSLSATFPASQQVYWFAAPSGGAPLQTGNPLIVNPTDTTVYYAEVRDTASTGGGCLRITEVELSDVSTAGGDYIEIQNLSGGVIDATGWVVAASDSYNNINLVNATTWALAVLNAGEVQIRYDANSGTNYWGQNLLFNGGNNGWVMIVDGAGQVVDFVAFGWSDADILGMNVTINGFPITIGSNWIGAGAVSCASGSSVSRIGSTDNDDNTDWTCQAGSETVTNPNLTPIFSACGSGSCASDRVPVQVDVIPLPVVSLGNDTIIAAPNTVTLDAGAGFTSYLWSNASITQTIVVSASGNYTVTVTDANGCQGTDVIAIVVLTGINDFGANSEVVLSPVPTRDYLTVTLNNMIADDYTVSLLNNLGQRIMFTTVNVQSNNVQNKFDLAGMQKGIYYIEIKSEKGISRHRILIQ